MRSRTAVDFGVLRCRLAPGLPTAMIADGRVAYITEHEESLDKVGDAGGANWFRKPNSAPMAGPRSTDGVVARRRQYADRAETAKAR